MCSNSLPWENILSWFWKCHPQEVWVCSSGRSNLTCAFAWGACLVTHFKVSQPLQMYILSSNSSLTMLNSWFPRFLWRFVCGWLYNSHMCWCCLFMAGWCLLKGSVWLLLSKEVSSCQTSFQANCFGFCARLLGPTERPCLSPLTQAHVSLCGWLTIYEPVVWLKTQSF